jgi:hypothetical protein
MTVKLELTLTLEPQVAGSFAKSQGVTIKSTKEHKGDIAVNFSQQNSEREEGQPDERPTDQENMLQYIHSKCCKALRRTVKLMHDIVTAGVILLAMTVKLELPSLDHCSRKLRPSLGSQ